MGIVEVRFIVVVEEEIEVEVVKGGRGGDGLVGVVG